MSRAYGLVLVAAPAGLLVPLGRDGWTLAGLATALDAPAVVVTGPGPDAVNHATLALGALAGHGIAACLVTIGEVDEAALPVTPGGRIPAGDTLDYSRAAEWLEPLLRPAATPEPEPVPATADRTTFSGKRIVLGLGAVFVVMVLVACGLALVNRPPEQDRSAGVRHVIASTMPMPMRPSPRHRSSGDVCPEYSGQGVVTHANRATRATRARVNAAWLRIEKWLAAHAPVAARALRPGASQARIDELQRRMSVAFPPDLVVSLRRHDGTSGGFRFTLPPGHEPVALEGILSDWRTNCEVAANLEQFQPSEWWNRAYIPFAMDGSGGALLTDQRPGSHGRVGDFYPENGTVFDNSPASVAELLELTATSLETGRPYATHYRPRVDAGGSLGWS